MPDDGETPTNNTQSFTGREGTRGFGYEGENKGRYESLEGVADKGQDAPTLSHAP